MTPTTRKQMKRKSATLDVPASVQEAMPEIALFNEMIELEREMDSIIAVKEMELAQAKRSARKSPRTLQLVIASKLVPSESSPLFPCWQLTVRGKLKDDLQTPSAYKLSSFFKQASFSVTSPSSEKIENPTAEWHRSDEKNDVDCFALKRKSQHNCTVQVVLTPLSGMVRLSNELQQIMRVPACQREDIVLSLWQIIKKQQLQHPSDPSLILLSPEFALLGQKPTATAPPLPSSSSSSRNSGAYFSVSDIASLVDRHAPSMPSPTFTYEIKIDGSSPPQCYDIVVDAFDPAFDELVAAQNSATDASLKLQELETKLETALNKIDEHRYRHAFFEQMASDPLPFLQNFLAAEFFASKRARDAVDGETDMRRSAIWRQPWVKEAVSSFVTEEQRKKELARQAMLEQIQQQQLQQQQQQQQQGMLAYPQS